MNRFLTLIFCAALTAAGCNESAPTPSAAPASKVDKIQAALDKLSPEDRALADEQKYCPESGEPLGSMDTPIKVMVKDQPVFVCCKSCVKGVQKDPDETLKKVEELKTRNKPAK
ncbi:MAG TPA: hypothetical protein VKD90_09605 [Gemmataceae bacterium]|nr:hypothetical protein [Gemmataceae bacterium]